MIWAKLDNMKRSRMSVVLSCIDLSWLGNVLACIDRKGQFFLYKMINVAELNGPMTVPNAVTQLEYCLITGEEYNLSWLGNVLACIDRKGQFFLY
jgi:hypothetical protein